MNSILIFLCDNLPYFFMVWVILGHIIQVNYLSEILKILRKE